MRTQRSVVWHNFGGQGMAEFIILVMLVAVIVLVGVRLFGRSVRCSFSSASAQIDSDAASEDCDLGAESSAPVVSPQPPEFVPPLPPPLVPPIPPPPTATPTPTSSCGKLPAGASCLGPGKCCATLDNRDSCRTLCCPSRIAFNCFTDKSDPRYASKCFCGTSGGVDLGDS